MDRKVIGLFAIFLVAVLAMGAVSATNLENHDFDGYFSMKIPKDITFEKEENSSNEDGMEMVSLTYLSENLGIFYMESPVYNEYSSYYAYQSTFEIMNPDLTKCYESQEDNLRILEPTKHDDTHFSLVGTSSGDKLIMLMGDDVDLLKEMGHSIQFN